MRKFGPNVGDTGVIGTIDFITRNALGSCGKFNALTIANGYAFYSFPAMTAPPPDYIEPTAGYCLEVLNVPDDLQNGDQCTADIVQDLGLNILGGTTGPYATNLQKV
jgi:hypothetical protein